MASVLRALRAGVVATRGLPCTQCMASGARATRSALPGLVHDVGTFRERRMQSGGVSSSPPSGSSAAPRTAQLTWVATSAEAPKGTQAGERLLLVTPLANKHARSPQVITNYCVCAAWCGGVCAVVFVCLEFDGLSTNATTEPHCATARASAHVPSIAGDTSVSVHVPLCRR
jgi:hypothetical protein